MIMSGHAAYGHTIARAAGAVYNPVIDCNIARVERGQLFGGVVYQSYTGKGGSIYMHVAGFVPKWANRDMLWIAFDYPFKQLECGVVLAHVHESNTKALEMELRLGFKIVSKIEGAFPDGACLVLSLAREDCRWLNLTPRGLIRSKD